MVFNYLAIFLGPRTEKRRRTYRGMTKLLLAFVCTRQNAAYHSIAQSIWSESPNSVIIWFILDVWFQSHFGYTLYHHIGVQCCERRCGHNESFHCARWLFFHYTHVCVYLFLDLLMIWAATAKDEDRKCARRHVIVVALLSLRVLLFNISIEHDTAIMIANAMYLCIIFCSVSRLSVCCSQHILSYRILFSMLIFLLLVEHTLPIKSVGIAGRLCCVFFLCSYIFSLCFISQQYLFLRWFRFGIFNITCMIRSVLHSLFQSVSHSVMRW